MSGGVSRSILVAFELKQNEKSLVLRRGVLGGRAK